MNANNKSKYVLPYQATIPERAPPSDWMNCGTDRGGLTGMGYNNSSTSSSWRGEERGGSMFANKCNSKKKEIFFAHQIHSFPGLLLHAASSRDASSPRICAARGGSTIAGDDGLVY